MRDYGVIRSGSWRSGALRGLRGDLRAQLLAVYLPTCESMHMTGVAYLPLPVVALETGIAESDLASAFARLEEIAFAYFDRADSLVWVPSVPEHEFRDRLAPRDKRVKPVEKHLAAIGEGHPFVADFRARFMGGPAVEAMPHAMPHPKGHAEGDAMPQPMPGSGSGAGAGAGERARAPKPSAGLHTEERTEEDTLVAMTETWPIDDETRAAATMLGLRDVDAAWASFRAKSLDKPPQSRRAWLAQFRDVWAPRSKKYEAQDQARGQKPMRQPVAPVRAWQAGDIWKPGDGT